MGDHTTNRHKQIDNPGLFTKREKPLSRTNWKQRAFTVGIGGTAGAGKTHLINALCKHLRDKYNICIVTNDMFTREDRDFLLKHEALHDEERIHAVTSRGCSYYPIASDLSANVEAVKELTRKFSPNFILLESGGLCLATTFNRELVDYSIFVIDVAGGDKIPKKGGPAITQCDLLVVNKTDLASSVGADLAVMSRDANAMRQNGPTIFIQARNNLGTLEVVQHILSALENC